jgi:hypothetical protein
MSTNNNNVMVPISAGHPQSGTTTSAKFEFLLPAANNIKKCVPLLNHVGEFPR